MLITGSSTFYIISETKDCTIKETISPHKLKKENFLIVIRIGVLKDISDNKINSQQTPGLRSQPAVFVKIYVLERNAK